MPFVVFPKNSNMLALLFIFSLFSHVSKPNSSQPDKPHTNTPQTIIEKLVDFLLLSETCEKSGGFTKDTLVKTPTGYTKIQDLKVGSLVVTLDETTNTLCEQPISAVKSVLAPKVIWLTFSDNLNTRICSGIMQAFCTTSPLAKSTFKNHSWLNLSGLQNAKILTRNTCLKVLINQKEAKLTKLYLIEVAGNHNYFVTMADILVHNTPFALPLIGVVTPETIAAAGAMIATAILGTKDPTEKPSAKPKAEDDKPEKPASNNPEIKDNQEQESVVAVAGGSPGGPGKPPKKDNEEDKDKKQDAPNKNQNVECTGECNNKSCAKIADTLTKLAESEAKRADLATEQQSKTNSTRGWETTESKVNTGIQGGVLGVMLCEYFKDNDSKPELVKFKRKNDNLENSSTNSKREEENLEESTNKSQKQENELKYEATQQENTKLKQTITELEEENERLKNRLAHLENRDFFR